MLDLESTKAHWQEIKAKPVDTKPTGYVPKKDPVKAIKLAYEYKLKLKHEYNTLLKREANGTKWINENTGKVPDSKFNLAKTELINIQNRLSEIMGEMGTMTPDEIEFGFEFLEEQALC